MALPPPACSKCKFGAAEEGDSWCLGCRAVEAGQSTLKVRWWSVSHRRAAEETLFDAVRQIRALKQLDQSSQSLRDSLQAKIKKFTATSGRSGSAPSRPEVKQEKPPEPKEPPRASRDHLQADTAPGSCAESESDFGESYFRRRAFRPR